LEKTREWKKNDSVNLVPTRARATQSPIILEKFMMLLQIGPTSMERHLNILFLLLVGSMLGSKSNVVLNLSGHHMMAWATGDTHEEYQALPLRKDKFMLLSLGVFCPNHFLALLP
jgi:hypothetical protein